MNINSFTPQVILSANISYYANIAAELQIKGLLKLFITGIGIENPDSIVLKLLPGNWRNKLKGRDFSGISGDHIKTLWIPELIQRIPDFFGVFPSELARLINAYFFDWYASQFINECEIFHGLTSTGLISAKKAKKLGAKVLFEERSLYIDNYKHIVDEENHHFGINKPNNNIKKEIERKIVREYAFSDFLLVPSQIVKDALVSSGYDPRKIYSLSYGVDTELFSPCNNENNKDRKYRIIYVGSISPAKGVHYLIEAFINLRLPNSELIIIGSGNQEYVEAINKSTNQNIYWLGHIAKIELPKYYRSASVFVLPSLADSFGMVTLEAMSCGLPVVITENVGSKEIVDDGIDGYIVPIRNVEALECRLEELYNNSNTRLKMGEAARVKANNYSWQEYTVRLINIYLEIS